MTLETGEWSSQMQMSNFANGCKYTIVFQIQSLLIKRIILDYIRFVNNEKSWEVLPFIRNLIYNFYITVTENLKTVTHGISIWF